jgi:hypothetical protein
VAGRQWSHSGGASGCGCRKDPTAPVAASHRCPVQQGLLHNVDGLLHAGIRRASSSGCNGCAGARRPSARRICRRTNARRKLSCEAAGNLHCTATSTAPHHHACCCCCCCTTRWCGVASPGCALAAMRWAVAAPPLLRAAGTAAASRRLAARPAVAGCWEGAGSTRLVRRAAQPVSAGCSVRTGNGHAPTLLRLLGWEWGSVHSQPCILSREVEPSSSGVGVTAAPWRHRDPDAALCGNTRWDPREPTNTNKQTASLSQLLCCPARDRAPRQLVRLCAADVLAAAAAVRLPGWPIAHQSSGTSCVAGRQADRDGV